MAEFHERHPGLDLELTAEPWPVSLTNHEADIAVVLNRPPKGGFLRGVWSISGWDFMLQPIIGAP
jgi:DNA-binding transcriptional LysR family regulator